MANAYTVLVVDDEPPIRRFLRTSLTASDYRVVEAEDAAGALRLLPAEKPDLVVLDLGLPDQSGLELIAEIRKTSAVPIVVLSARHDERSKVEALDLGADDYVSKPFGMAEMMARLRAALRHAFQAQGELPVFVSGDLTVDLVRRHVTRGGREVKLSPKEFDLLRHLVMHAGKVLTHRHLLREVWGPAQAEEVQYLRVFIRGLRQKLEPDPTRPTHILTELGVGYRLQLPPSSAPERRFNAAPPCGLYAANQNLYRLLVSNGADPHRILMRLMWNGGAELLRCAGTPDRSIAPRNAGSMERI